MEADERRTSHEAEPEVQGLDGSGVDMARIISLSDGIFAFSLTFLVVTLVLPTAFGSGHLPGLWAYLRSLEPALIAYGLAFFIIASWWTVHHRLFSPIVRYDQLLVRLNNVFLLEMSVTPFLVGILFEYGPSAAFGPQTPENQAAVMLYSGTQVLAGLTLLAIWRHSTRGHRLVSARLPAEWIEVTERDHLALLGVFAVSIPIALLSPFGSELVWILMIFGFGRRLVFRRRPRNRASAGPADRPSPPDAGPRA
ncbi:MAG TPA: TMEM175 family protein [Thermoplasmata archaeon]|nr:TMEM175 family protein [Thermoplasmata archaeon]